MKEIEVDFSVVRDGETIYEGYSTVKITDKNVKEVEAFIREGHYSGQLVDVPSHVYDRIEKAVIETAIGDMKQEMKDALLESDEVLMQEVLPLDLVNLIDPELHKLIDLEAILNYYNLLNQEEEPNEDEDPLSYDYETKYWKIIGEEEPNDQNSLYLTIKQAFFDQIIAGTKTVEYREVKETTYKKYLECDANGYPLVVTDLVPDPDNFDFDILTWNNGIYPYLPKQNLRYLKLAVGYNKERDTALVELDGFKFVPATFKDQIARCSVQPDNSLIPDPNGPLCLWIMEMHIKRVVECHRKA